ncbi:MAG: ATP-binding cassette domain-containing protein [Candidatus Thalassarchaeaceae archaeon]|nr:ATP-binding cassette domain-containing protein [Candidatus Thalassarchaeaceae archaeon]
MADSVLSIRSADIGFTKDEPLLKSVNLEVQSGEIVGIIGRSGIGKTTLLRTIANLIPPLEGDVDAPLERGEIGYIPQRLGLITHQTVGYNVIMGGLPNAPLWQSLLSLPGHELREASREAIAAVDLSEKVLDPISELSGGQQRRVAIARSMVQKPTLLLADECLGELDADTAKGIVKLIQSLAKEGNVAIIVVDHNPVRASTFCDRILQIKGSRLEEVNI